MITSVLVTLALAQPYARSRMVEGDNTTQCLWWKEKSVIEWRTNAAGNTETPGSTEFSAISAAFATWQTRLASCASISLVDKGTSPSRLAEHRAATGATNENLVLFREKSCKGQVPVGDACASDGSCGNKYDCWQFTEGAIAITTTSYHPRTGQIVDSDIELNTPSYYFTTVDSPPCVRGNESFSCVATDVQNTMTHEVGHLLGLAHIRDSASTMNPSAVTGELTKRTLDPGSERFVCDVYPPGQPTKQCFTSRLAIEESEAPVLGCASAAGLPLVALGLLVARRHRRG